MDIVPHTRPMYLTLEIMSQTLKLRIEIIMRGTSIENQAIVAYQTLTFYLQMQMYLHLIRLMNSKPESLTETHF